MDVYKAIYKRCSTRSFDETRDVSLELVNKILEAACQAPSAGDVQPWRFWVVRNPQLKDKLTTAAINQQFIAEAPVVIIVCSNLDVCGEAYGTRGRELYAIQDAAAATENILLAACSEGLGVCWVGAFYEDNVAELLDLPKNLKPLAIIPLGYPVRKNVKPSRMPIEDVVEYLD
ncbi:nitroreductase family protein [Candidatus Oleimmundimicrobium sp.]|uniref:nitroreductase family protein n=1 Tax=Candidatus Oleimmundimicrobium sp. TaxID=3060597 RepID=UPI0027248D68|nr:nitroreductase family protein [Candidatus Oleimmundimicrobium sp.]MDO8886015.1 nitroreductase family protein [Candidatus Oleimmundimicrobium sp.]